MAQYSVTYIAYLCIIFYLYLFMCRFQNGGKWVYLQAGIPSKPGSGSRLRYHAPKVDYKTRKMPGSTSVTILHLTTTGTVLGAISVQIATNVAVHPHQHSPLAAPPTSTGQSTHHPGPQERDSSNQRTTTWCRCITERIPSRGNHPKFRVGSTSRRRIY
jgi:hypothetical protein